MTAIRFALSAQSMSAQSTRATAPGRRRRVVVTAATVTLATAGLAACSSAITTDAGSAPASNAASPAAEACPVTAADAWVKSAESGMTSAYATLANTSGSEVTVIAASSPAATKTEMHEVVDSGGQMQMQMVQGGFKIPANAALALEPGGYHLMLMDLTAPIKAGESLPFTLTCPGGSTATFTAQAKDYTGANEQYAGDGMESMGSMDSGDGMESMDAMPSGSEAP